MDWGTVGASLVAGGGLGALAGFGTSVYQTRQQSKDQERALKAQEAQFEKSLALERERFEHDKQQIRGTVARRNDLLEEVRENAAENYPGDVQMLIPKAQSYGLATLANSLAGLADVLRAAIGQHQPDVQAIETARARVMQEVAAIEHGRSTDL
jgi:hypothetical protein